jgi:hypothetical protein
MTAMWTYLEIAKLGASWAGPIATLAGFLFVWKQLGNTALQIEIAQKNLEATNQQSVINQKWKRAEFVAAEIKLFYDNEIVSKTLQMLDYEARYYDIGIVDKAGKTRRTMVVQLKSEWPKTKDDISYVAIEDALRIYNVKRDFTDEEVIIRDWFDVLLANIERFEQFLKAKLVSEEEIVPYLRYYLLILRGGLGSCRTRTNIDIQSILEAI